MFGLDHLTKWLVVQHLALGDQWPSSGPITIHHIQNRGAAFGLFPQLQTVFLVVAVLVSAYIIVAGPRFAMLAGPAYGLCRCFHARCGGLGGRFEGALGRWPSLS